MTRCVRGTIISFESERFCFELVEGESVQKEFWDCLFLWKRMYSRAMEPVCERYDLSRMELDVLLFLANNPQWDTSTHIVEHRQLSKSHVSTSVRHLETAGYVARQFRAGNRRTAHLVVLPPAEQVVEAARAARRELVDRVFSGFSREEIQQLEQFLHRINCNIQGSQQCLSN